MTEVQVMYDDKKTRRNASILRWVLMVVSSLGMMAIYLYCVWRISESESALAACQQENADLKGKVKAAEKKYGADPEWLLRNCQKRVEWAVEDACRCSKRCDPNEPPESECSRMVVECERVMMNASFEKALGVEEAPR